MQTGAIILRKPAQFEKVLVLRSGCIVRIGDFCGSQLSLMMDRLHSAKTLEEGMTQVGNGNASARKRELEEKIAVAWLSRLPH